MSGNHEAHLQCCQNWTGIYQTQNIGKVYKTVLCRAVHTCMHTIELYVTWMRSRRIVQAWRQQPQEFPQRKGRPSFQKLFRLPQGGGLHAWL